MTAMMAMREKEMATRRKCFELSTPRDHSVIAHTITTTRMHVLECVTDTVLPLKDIMGICD